MALPITTSAPLPLAASISFVVISSGVTCAVLSSISLAWLMLPSSHMVCSSPFFWPFEPLATDRVLISLKVSSSSSLASSLCIRKDSLCSAVVGPEPHSPAKKPPA